MKRLPLLAAIFLVTLVGMMGVSSAADNAMQTVITQVQNIQMAFQALPATVNAGVQGKSKMYYLTKNSFDGGDAITACDSGFHMASISEIQAPSNLQYRTPAYDSPYDSPAFDQASDQFTDHPGWVRTGFSSDPDPFSREDDCSLWTARSSAVSGPTVQFLSTWDVPDTCPLSCERWMPSTSTCESHLRVWCAEDPT